MRAALALRASRLLVIAASDDGGSLAEAYFPDSTCLAVVEGNRSGASSRKDRPSRAAEYMARSRSSVKSQKALSASEVAISTGWSARSAISSTSSIGGGPAGGPDEDVRSPDAAGGPEAAA